MTITNTPRTIRFRVGVGSSRRWEEIPRVLWSRLEGIKPTEDFASSDGATMAPDYVFYPIWEDIDPFREDEAKLRWVKANLAGAYIIHDYAYWSSAEIGGASRSLRRHEDKVLARNVIRCALFYGADWAQAKSTAWKWYWAVRRFGGYAYTFAQGEKDFSWWHRWCDFRFGADIVWAEHQEKPYGPQSF